MSWRRLVDARGEKLEIDWPRLAVVLVAGHLMAGLLVWLLSVYPLGAVAIIVLVMPIAAFLIWLDVKIRRRDADRQ
jgi:hypothetical protein